MTLLIVAWGNPSRGDDAAGPWLAEALQPVCNENVVLIEDVQLQVEHLLDCQQAELLLFLDAHCAGGEDFDFREVLPRTTMAHTSHALSPAELLGYYARTFAGELPPAAFQLTVPGQWFELGDAMTGATLKQCQRALQFVDLLMKVPTPQHWRELARGRAATAAQGWPARSAQSRSSISPRDASSGSNTAPV
jgi:hydrogenase maturation protease